MKGICGSGAFGHIPCASDSPPEPLTDQLAISTLAQMCPNVAKSSTLCCDKDQVMDMSSMFDLYGLFMKPCPACFANYMNIVCQLVCSPAQATFTKVMAKETNEDGQEAVLLVDYFVNDQYAQQVYNSCQNVTRFGIKAIDNFCKPWSADSCNYKRMWSYVLADLDHGGHNPYQVDIVYSQTDVHVFEDVQYLPLKDTALNCWEPALGQAACPCDHCPKSCT